MDSMKKMAHGVIVPLLTPLCPDETLDLAGLERLVEHVVAGGVDAIFVMGTSGEFARFNDEMQAQCIAETVRLAKGRLPVFAGVSAGGVHQVLQHIQRAADAGASAVVTTAPYYFPNQNADELTAFFTQVLDHSSLPVLLYNIPATIGSTIPLNVLDALYGHPRLIGIKDSGGDVEYLKQLLDRFASPDFAVIAGVESILQEALNAGADGMVPSMANPFPKLLSGVWSACCSHDESKLEELYSMVDRFNKLNDYTTCWMSPNIWRKEALAQMGICAATMAQPSLPMPEEARRQTAALVAEYQTVFEK